MSKRIRYKFSIHISCHNIKYNYKIQLIKCRMHIFQVHCNYCLHNYVDVHCTYASFVMKKTKVPIIVSGFLWVTNTENYRFLKNMLKGRGSMAKNKI